MNGSISLVILMVNKELFVDGRQQSIMLQFVQNSHNTISFIVLHCKNQASVPVLVQFFRIVYA